MIAQVVVRGVARRGIATIGHEVLDDIHVVVVRNVGMSVRVLRMDLVQRGQHTRLSLEGLKREDAAQQQEQKATQHGVTWIFAQLARCMQGTPFAPSGAPAITWEPCMSLSLRIALISEHASPLAAAGGVDAGGQNIYVAQVARCLARAGHEVTVFTRRDAIEHPTCLTWLPGVKVVHVTAGPAHFVPKECLLPHMPAFAEAVEQHLRESGGCDVVHANFFMSGWVAHRLKRTMGLPYVVTFHALGLVRREHQGEADTFPAARVSIERMLVKDADLLIAECPQDERDLMQLYGADPARVRMVPCGFDAGEFSPMDRGRARAELGLPADGFLLLQLGRLVPRKGIDNVIESLAHLPADTPATLMVVGGECRNPDQLSSPEFLRLQALARTHGVADRVAFLGHRQRQELRRHYAAANVFVTTPWYEPFGITPLEAMACGVPVVASAVGGLTYSVTEGQTGRLVPPRDPQALARVIAHLHRHPEVARAMGRAGLRRVRTHFTWERVTDSLLSAYRESLSPDLGAALSTLQGVSANQGASSHHPGLAAIG